jgi:hypothetical protein
MLFYKAFHPAQLHRSEPATVCQSDRLEPKLRFKSLPLNVNMNWFCMVG